MAGITGDTTAWFSVLLESDGVVRKRELVELNLDEIMADVIEKLSSYDETVTFEVFVGPSADRLDIKLPNYSKVEVPYNFGYRFIKFVVRNTAGVSSMTNATQRVGNAFDVLAAARDSEKHMPPKRRGQKSNDRFFNDMVDVLVSLDVGFKHSQVQTLGTKITGVLYNCLWYIEPHHVKLAERGCQIPKPFHTLTGYIDYKGAHKAIPRISAEVLKNHIDDVSDVLLLTFTGRKQRFFESVKRLVEALKKYHDTLEKQQNRSNTWHASPVPLRNKDNNFTLRTIAKVEVVGDKHKELNDEMLSKDLYEPVWLNDFRTLPTDRYERRHWIEGIGLSCPLQLYSYEHGNNFGTYRFVWKVPESPEDRSEDKVLRIISNIHQSLPSYHTRSMQKLFFDRYRKVATITKSVLRNMYRFLTEAELPDSSASADIDHRLLFVLQSDDPNILWDLRKLNGSPGSTKFDTFWEEVHRYFEENTPAVQERRHGQHLYLPFAVSVEDLVSTIKQRLPPDTAIPSAEWVRLQFWPSDPTTRRAYLHTGRLNIKFAVQARQMRATHEDSQYCYHQLKLMKEFAVKWNSDLLLFWLDDKAIVPIGEVGKPISATPRSHNKGLGSATGPKLGALDHDFHLCGAIPSAVLKSDIPESADETFFRGEVFVTVKDKVFQPSDTWRHSCEMVKLVRNKYSEDEVNANKSIVIHYTDGGPDHRTTYMSVQLASVAQFILLDLDMFATIRTAPMGSWANLAERVNALLNLGLQHVSLEREPMTPELETTMARNKTLKDIRIAANKNKALSLALNASVQPVLKTIESRFSKLKLKGEDFQVLPPATTDEIQDLFSTLHLIDDQLQRDKVGKSDVQKSPRVVEFFDRHCQQHHYSFQVRKCKLEDLDRCWYCSLCPPRLPEEKYRELFLVPDPVCGPDNTFLPFDSVYGTCTQDTDRPSLKSSLTASPRDVQHKTLLVGTRVRGSIRCVECQKPRVIYSAKKLTFTEKTLVERCRQESMYTCGVSLFPPTTEVYDSVIVRESLKCSTPVEVTYYSGKTCSLPDVCIHCGQMRDLVVDEDIQELKAAYTTVRPICRSCKANGKEPLCRGPKNVGKRQRRN